MSKDRKLWMFMMEMDNNSLIICPLLIKILVIVITTIAITIIIIMMKMIYQQDSENVKYLILKNITTNNDEIKIILINIFFNETESEN